MADLGEKNLEMTKLMNIKDVISIKPIERLVPLKRLTQFLGPAFIVSVAYIDPGNFATNITGGSLFNYNLLWVILWSNVMAIFLQINSAKLGIATGFNLSEMCRRTFGSRVNWFLWVVAELAAMATTMAEFLGGALGLYLLFGIPLVFAGLITGVITFIITSLQKYGQKVVERIILLLVTVICGAYGIELLLAKPDWAQIGLHTLVPGIPNGQAMLIAVGMLGATVMPHVIYLHSQLVQCRNTGMTEIEKYRHLRMEKIDIAIAMNIAFFVNAAMVIVSAAVFYRNGLVVESINSAHQSLRPLLGDFSGSIFAIALLASGFSSSTVGTMAGESVMDGFVNVRIPPNLKRLITMLPAMLVIIAGINPMKALILSQVSLSFALPAAIIPLLYITGQKSVMGIFVNKPLVKTAGYLIAAAIIALNMILLLYIFMGKV